MASPKTRIAIIGTLDTKLDEFLYLRAQMLDIDPSIDPILIDVGRSQTHNEHIRIPQPDIMRRSGYAGDAASSAALPRGAMIRHMSAGCAGAIRDIISSSSSSSSSQQLHLHGAVSLGGSGGTSIAAAAMRDGLPLTVPKLIVSTVASGDTASYVAEADITLMYSVVDIAGLNAVLRAVLRNAAAAIVGMARDYHRRQLAGPDSGGLLAGGSTAQGGKTKRKKKAIGITMFGVTTPAVDEARRWLEEQREEGSESESGSESPFEVYVFHATGAGGRAMERLVREGRLDGVLDLTTTELADELVGGVMSAGPDRLTAAARAGVPQIVSVGALDMVNFGPRDTVPEAFGGRRGSGRDERGGDEAGMTRTLFEHNPSVTLMRTTPDECAELGRRLARRLKENRANPYITEVWLPLRGVSAIAVRGQPFHDEEADRALFGAVQDGLKGSGIAVTQVDAHINDPAWARSIVKRLVELMELKDKA